MAISHQLHGEEEGVFREGEWESPGWHESTLGIRPASARQRDGKEENDKVCFSELKLTKLGRLPDGGPWALALWKGFLGQRNILSRWGDNYFSCICGLSSGESDFLWDSLLGRQLRGRDKFTLIICTFNYYCLCICMFCLLVFFFLCTVCGVIMEAGWGFWVPLELELQVVVVLVTTLVLGINPDSLNHGAVPPAPGFRE